MSLILDYLDVVDTLGPLNPSNPNVFTDVNFDTHFEGKKLFVVLSCGRGSFLNGTVTGVTVEGEPVTEIVQSISSGGHSTHYIGVIDAPEVSSGDIQVSFSAAHSFIVISLFANKEPFDNFEILDTTSLSGSDSADINLNVTNKSFAFVLAGLNGDIEFGNVDGHNVLMETDFNNYQVAHGVSEFSDGDFGTIWFDLFWDGSNTNVRAIGASFNIQAPLEASDPSFTHLDDYTEENESADTHESDPFSLGSEEDDRVIAVALSLSRTSTIGTVLIEDVFLYPVGFNPIRMRVASITGSGNYQVAIFYANVPLGTTGHIVVHTSTATNRSMLFSYYRITGTGDDWDPVFTDFDDGSPAEIEFANDDDWKFIAIASNRAGGSGTIDINLIGVDDIHFPSTVVGPGGNDQHESIVGSGDTTGTTKVVNTNGERLVLAAWDLSEPEQLLYEVTDTRTSTTALSNGTLFADVNFGAESSNRIILFALAWKSSSDSVGRSLNDVIIGGVSATRIVRSSLISSQLRNVEFWEAHVPNGLTGDIEIIASNNINRWSAAIIRLDGNQLITTDAIVGLGGETPQRLNAPAFSGLTIAGAVGVDNAPITLTGLDEEVLVKELDTDFSSVFKLSQFVSKEQVAVETSGERIALAGWAKINQPALPPGVELGAYSTESNLNSVNGLHIVASRIYLGPPNPNRHIVITNGWRVSGADRQLVDVRINNIEGSRIIRLPDGSADYAVDAWIIAIPEGYWGELRMEANSSTIERQNVGVHRLIGTPTIQDTITETGGSGSLSHPSDGYSVLIATRPDNTSPELDGVFVFAEDIYSESNLISDFGYYDDENSLSLDLTMTGDRLLGVSFSGLGEPEPPTPTGRRRRLLLIQG